LKFREEENKFVRCFLFIKTGLKPIGLGRNLKFLKEVDRIIEDVKNSIENAVTFSKAFSKCKFNQLWEHSQQRIFSKRSNHINTYLFHGGDTEGIDLWSPQSFAYYKNKNCSRKIKI
jgi:hypothetical protein